MENITFPEWYMSSNGPKVSQTIFNIIGGFLPVINLALSSKGINVLPGSVNLAVSLAVFAYFSVKALLGYIKGKRALQAQIGSLQSLAGVNSGDIRNYVWYGPHPCQRCDADGKKRTEIVKAGNGAPDDLEFDFTHDSQYPNHIWKRHVCLKV